MISTLQSAGFTVTPCRGKAPFLSGWQTKGLLDSVSLAKYAAYNVGLVLGVAPWYFVALDIDSTCEPWADACERLAMERWGLCPVRIGRWPKRLVLLRLSAPARKWTGPWLEDLVGDRCRLEVLGQGQQCVVAGTHPDTGQAYQWTDPLGGLGVDGWMPEDVPLTDWGAVLEWTEACLKDSARWGLKAISTELSRAGAHNTGRETEGGMTSPRDPLETYAPPLGLSIAEARQLLFDHGGDPSDYDNWLRAGMALHHEFSTRFPMQGVDLWDEWSASADNYAGHTDITRRWDGFGRSVAAGGKAMTLKYLVKRAGDATRVEREASGAEPKVDWSSGGAAVLRTEFGNARRMVAQHAGKLLWCAGLGWWFHWTGNHWARAYEADVLRYAQATVNGLIDAAKALPREEAGEALKWAARSQTKGMCSAMVALAAAAPELRVEVDELDADKTLLGVANGMVDLRTGRLLPPDPRARITRVTDVRYVEGAECPVFLRTVDEVFAGQPMMPGFFQRLVGYSIIGDPREHLMVFLIGNGGNGKSTLQNAIRFALGGHCVSAHASSFVREGPGGAAAGGARPDLLALHGARLVLVSEPPEGSELREDVIKSMAGGDALPARALYSSHIVQIQPSWTAWLSTNHKPIIKGEDMGIWRRVLPVPFLRDFENDPGAVKDVDRAARLRAEAEGVLAWCVAGAVEYYRQGLRVPGEVSASRGEYRADMDLLAEWLRERCIVGASEGSAEARSVSLDALWLDWEPWARTRGELRYVHSRKMLSKRLQSRGFGKEYTRHGAVIVGLNLRNTSISEA